MTGLWQELSHSLRALLETHALPVIVTILFFEELGVPSPIPGDLMMILAGIRVRQGLEPLWLVLLAQQLATLAGTCSLFALSRRGGRKLLLRYGRFLHLSPAHLARAEAAIQRSGGRAVVIGRLVPGLRIVTPLAAGVLGQPFRVFLPAITLGSFLYIFFYTMLGVLLGPVALSLLEQVTRSASAVLSLAALVGLVFLAWRLEHELPPAPPETHYPPRTALLAGFFAGMIALLATNVLIDLTSLLLRLANRPQPLLGPAGNSGLRLLLGWPVFLLAAVVLALVAGVLGLARLPAPARVALLTAIPLAFMLAIVDPLTDRFRPNLTVRHTALLLAIETLRWLAFGLALGDFLSLASRLRRRGLTNEDEDESGAMPAEREAE